RTLLAGAAGRIGPVQPRRGAFAKLHVGRAVARRDSPDGGAVILAAARIGDCIGLLRIDRAARVFEVIEAAPAHVRILKLAEIDPYMRVLVTEKRRKVQELLAEKLTPAGRIIRAGPFGPSLGLHRVRR